MCQADSVPSPELDRHDYIYSSPQPLGGGGRQYDDSIIQKRKQRPREVKSLGRAGL